MNTMSEKMISVSKASNSLFSDCEKVFDHICPNCGEKIYHTFNNKQGIEKIDFYTACDCVTDAWEQETLKKLYDNHAQIIRNNKQASGFSKRDAEDVSKSFKTHKGNVGAYNALIAYGDKFDNTTKTGFFLYGPVGVGKSLLAKKAMTKVLNKGYSAYITSVSKMMSDIKKDNSSFSRDTFNKVLDVDLLILDDIGVERGTEFEIEQLFQILESRWRDYKPIIFTSNLTLEELSSKYHDRDRLMSRILGTCQIIKVDGQDFRAITV